MFGKSIFNRRQTGQADSLKETIARPEESSADKAAIADQGSGGFPGVEGHQSTHHRAASDRPEPNLSEPGVADSAIWYLADIPGRIQPGLTDEQKVIGPLTFLQVRHYVGQGMIDRKNSLVWTEGMKDWIPAGEVNSFFAGSIPPKVPNKPLAKNGLLFKGFALLFSFFCMLAMIPLLIIKAVFYGFKAAHRRIGVPKFGLRAHWWLTLFSQVLFCVFFGILMISMDGGGEDVMITFTVFSSVTAVACHFLWATLLCRLWEKVPEKHRTESPESLFPLFFIPVVHFYAMYLAIPTLRSALVKTIHPGSTESVFERRVLKTACVLGMIPMANIFCSLIMTGWMVSIRREVAYLAIDKDTNWMPSKV